MAEEQVPSSALIDDKVFSILGSGHFTHLSIADLIAMGYSLKEMVNPFLIQGQPLADGMDETDLNRKGIMVINPNRRHAAKLRHAMNAAM